MLESLVEQGVLGHLDVGGPWLACLMSSTYAEPFARLEECLDQLTAIDPAYRTVSEKQDAMRTLTKARTRIEAALLQVLATADDVAEATGARSPAAWLADETRQPHGTTRRDARLANALDQRWTHLAAAHAAGQVNPAQTRVIVEALDALPRDLDKDLLTKAETHLVDQAAHHGPRDLRILGARILSTIAPEVADHHEYHQLLAAERRAEATTRLTLRPRGDGSTDLHARIPDLDASRLRTYLAAFTSPRRHQTTGDDTPQTPDETRDEFAGLPLHRRHGIGFLALLERVLKSDLPRHGGKATTLAVLIDHDTLVADVNAAGLARTSTGDTITAGQARRLACQAGILPAILGTNSEILDLGREARFFNAPQRTAMEIRDQTCTETACTVPAAYCEVGLPGSHGQVLDCAW